jgi:hypothetical protein
MTLSTNIRLQRYTNPVELLDFINRELLQVTDPKTFVTTDEVGNQGGQGFDAWVIIKHNSGKPIFPEPMIEYQNQLEFYSNSRGEPFLDGRTPEEAAMESTIETLKYESKKVCFVDIDFDTAYGFQGPNGQECGDLHAAYIQYLADNYFTPRDIPFIWVNEFTGKKYRGAKKLETLTRGGADASAWFRNTVAPALAISAGL